MTRRNITAMIAFVCLIAIALPSFAADSEAAIIPPPAIYMPWGGTITTEVNFSDGDVLGIIKQAIPAIGELAKELSETPQARKSGRMGEVVSMIGGVNTRHLSDAIKDITNVRLIAMRYSRPMTVEQFAEDFSSGALKAGPFNKVLLNVGNASQTVGLFALPNNAGYMGFIYTPCNRTAYALRIAGSIDVQELIKFSGDIAKLSLKIHEQQKMNGASNSDEQGDL